MAEYPREFEFDALLRDGDVIHFRPIRPEDAPMEAAFIGRVGPQSMYQRFFQAKRELSPEELRYFTTVDYDDRMALVALDGDRMVAVGRYDVTQDEAGGGSRTAEVAFLVEDAYQGRGIGSLLLQHLTVYARLMEVTEFEAFVLADNFGMMRLFRSSGYHVDRSLDEDVFRIEFPTQYSPEARAADWEHERRSVTASLTPLFFPRRVAIVGAEQVSDHPGAQFLRNVVFGSYTGVVYPVNPARGFVHSIKSYPSIADVPDEIDLVLIAVPAAEAIEAVAEAGRRGVRAAIVSATTTVDHADWAERLLRAARRAGMRMLGPDSAGVAITNPKISLNAHVGSGAIGTGNVGLAAQSGALSTALLNDVARLRRGLSSFVSLGDAGDITANDLLIFWEGDPYTDVVALYVESFGNARRFGRLARRVSRSKPIVAVRGGRSGVEAGVVDHHVATEALFRSSGVIRAETMSEMFDVAQLLSLQPLPAGRKVAVIAEAPGPGSFATGALEANGLEVPSAIALADRQLENPIIAPAREHPELAAACAASASVDSIIVVETPGGGPESFGAGPFPIPTLLVRMGEPPRPKDLPIYPYPEQAARALAAVVRYAAWRAAPMGSVPEFPDVDRPGAAALVRKISERLGDVAGDASSAEMTELLHRFHITMGPPDGESVDVAISVAEDPLFGPLVEFRMSGRLAELSGDRSFRINPLSDSDAAAMVEEVRAAELVDRGVEHLVDLILRVSFLVENTPELVELHLDPVHVSPDGATVGKATARIRPLPGAFSPSRKDVPGRML